jgi:amidase
VPGTGGLNLDAAAIGQVHQAMSSGKLTAVALAQSYLERIEAIDRQLNSVIAVHPAALADAEASDARGRDGGPARALEGIPILVKDNIAVTGLPTTAGSRALAASAPPDAPLVTRLREAGAIVLGKTNLSEWANFRDEHPTSG